MKTIRYTNDTSQRLDVFLAATDTTTSRTQWQKAIKQELVLVNEQSVTPHYALIQNDTITISDLPKKEIVMLPDVDIEALAETPEYLVINKPSGIPVHPDDRYTENTLIQQLVKRFPDIERNFTTTPPSDKGRQTSQPTVGTSAASRMAKTEHGVRPGIVHRLDKDVSGIMVIARTPQMLDHLKKQFQKRTTKKQYLALVHDPLEKKQDTIELNIERDKKTGKMVTRPVNQPGKLSITHYEVLKNFTHFAYLSITITTGRTHQIRTVMRSLDHPVVGDTLYAKKKTKASIHDLNRPFLHSTRLGFYDLEKQWQEFDCPLPANLQTILDSLS